MGLGSESSPVLGGERAGTMLKITILAIDGGGIRGLISAVAPAETSESAPGDDLEPVDLVAGTSTAAIMACGLTCPTRCRPIHPPRAMRRRAEIFYASLWKTMTSLGGVIDQRDDSRELVKSLDATSGTRASVRRPPGSSLTVYDLDARQALALRRDDQASMVDAATRARRRDLL